MDLSLHFSGERPPPPYVPHMPSFRSDGILHSASLHGGVSSLDDELRRRQLLELERQRDRIADETVQRRRLEEEVRMDLALERTITMRKRAVEGLLDPPAQLDPSLPDSGFVQLGRSVDLGRNGGDLRVDGLHKLTPNEGAGGLGFIQFGRYLEVGRGSREARADELQTSAHNEGAGGLRILESGREVGYPRADGFHALAHNEGFRDLGFGQIARSMGLDCTGGDPRVDGLHAAVHNEGAGMIWDSRVAPDPAEVARRQELARIDGLQLLASYQGKGMIDVLSDALPRPDVFSSSQRTNKDPSSRSYKRSLLDGDQECCRVEVNVLVIRVRQDTYISLSFLFVASDLVDKGNKENLEYIHLG